MAQATEEATRESRFRGSLQQYRGYLREYWLEYLLVAPALVMLLLLLWLPFLRGIAMTFYNWPLGPGSAKFVGLDNWVYLFTWDPFWTSVRATLVYSLIIVFQLAIALTASLVVARLNVFQSIVSGALMIPYTMPPVVIGVIWMFMLSPNQGSIFVYLQDLGIIEDLIYWTANGPTAMMGIQFVMTWTFWPFMFLIILATLEGIPDEHYESARMYGANRVQQFFYVTLPQLKTAILVAVSIRMVWNLAKISQPYVLTQGGPSYETSILAILLYRFGYENGSLGRGYAVGLVLLAFSLVFVAIFIREFEREQRRS